ncbi:MAG: hypothetical protein ACXVHR_07680, partial [Methanobacterium sp.]
AIYSDHEIIIIKGCTFTNNIATRHGGAIYSDDGPFNAHFNRFYNNTAQNGTAIYCDDCSMNCTNNWWGNNTNPQNIPKLIVITNQGSLDADPWLIMTFTANPTTIAQGQTSTLTANFNINSDGDTVGDATNHIPNDTPVTFTTDSGKVYTASSGVVNSKSVVVYTVNGVATAILDGDALLTASLDNQTSTTTVTINSANAASQTTSTGKTIGMQNTGLPIAGLILAILALFGGLAGYRKS